MTGTPDPTPSEHLSTKTGGWLGEAEDDRREKSLGFVARWWCDSWLQYQLASPSPSSTKLACHHQARGGLQRAIACIPFESSRSWCVCLGAASLKPCLLPSSCECPCFHDTLPFSFLLFTAGDTLGSTYLSPCYSCSCPTPLPHFLDGYTCLLPFGLVLGTLAPLAWRVFTQRGSKDRALLRGFLPSPRGSPICLFLSPCVAVPLFLCLCPPPSLMAEPLLLSLIHGTSRPRSMWRWGRWPVEGLHSWKAQWLEHLRGRLCN